MFNRTKEWTFTSPATLDMFDRSLFEINCWHFTQFALYRAWNSPWIRRAFQFFRAPYVPLYSYNCASWSFILQDRETEVLQLETGRKLSEQCLLRTSLLRASYHWPQTLNISPCVILHLHFAFFQLHTADASLRRWSLSYLHRDLRLFYIIPGITENVSEYVCHLNCPLLPHL